jgi:hypothetical protein
MTRVKGNIVRGWSRVLERQALLEKLRSRLKPSTVTFFADPPLAASWVDSSPLTELFLALYETSGRAAALKFARDTTDEVSPFYIGVLSGVLRLFGTSPASLFARLNDFSKLTMEGVAYRWKSTSERSGFIEVVYPADYKMTAPQYLSVVPSFEIMFTICKIKGTIGDPELLNDHSARFEARW